MDSDFLNIVANKDRLHKELVFRHARQQPRHGQCGG